VKQRKGRAEVKIAVFNRCFYRTMYTVTEQVVRSKKNRL